MYADDSRGGHIANGPQIPLTQLPAIVGDSTTLLSHLQPVAGKPLTFRLTGLTLPAFEGMQLVPFYELYECRYQIYFPLYTAEQWKVRQGELAREEQARQQLETRTVDKVFCGEQQSESDHFFAASNSWNGSDNGVHWRRTRGVFGYQVKTVGARVVRLSGVGDDRQQLSLMLDGRSLGTVAFDGKKMVEVALPEGLTAETAKLEIAAVEGKETPRISEVRLLK